MSRHNRREQASYQDSMLTNMDGSLYVWTNGGWCPLSEDEEHFNLTDGESYYSLLEHVEELYEENIELQDELDTMAVTIEELELKLNTVQQELARFEDLGMDPEEIEQNASIIDEYDNEAWRIQKVANAIAPHLFIRGWQPVLITSDAYSMIVSMTEKSDNLKIFDAEYNNRVYSFLYKENLE